MTIQAGVHLKGTFSLSDFMRDVREKQSLQNVGAISFFIGIVRGKTFKGERVKRLEIEAYQEKANEVLINICRDLMSREGIVDVQIHHMLGEFNVGEELVYVSVAGEHRKNVFPVLEKAVDRYKKEVPIFKKEYVLNSKGEMRGCWITESKSGMATRVED